jgi:hypothetical protein
MLLLLLLTAAQEMLCCEPAGAPLHAPQLNGGTTLLRIKLKVHRIVGPHTPINQCSMQQGLALVNVQCSARY